MYWTALILGFTGSMHCVGMCSPLAMAVTNITQRAWLNRLLYNAGRITTYGLMGMVAASTDKLLPLAAYQNVVSILLGVLLLILAVVGIGGIKVPFFSVLMIKLTYALKTNFAHQLKRRNSHAMLIMGMINGLLPCGLTFIALLFCLALDNTLEGLTYMIVFGAGTLPAMLGLTVLLNPVFKRFQWNMRHVMTILLLVSAFTLIGRALTGHYESHSRSTTPQAEIVICR